MKRVFSYCLLLLICLVVSCKKQNDFSSESISTTYVSSRSMLCNGTASGKKIVEKGFCWNTLGAPSINNNKITTTGEEGNYSLLLDNLKPNTTYYVRAYCSSKIYTVYGSEMVFSTADSPTSITGSYSSLTPGSFITNGSVDTRGQALQEAGICWSKTTMPTIGNSKLAGMVTNNSYTCAINSLDSNTTYYYRSYARFSNETVYGEQKSVKTYAGRVKDIDGNLYYSVDIGGRLWTVSNLRTTRYRNGNSIPYYTRSNWFNIPVYAGGYGKYNDVTSAAPFGLLYNFFTIQDTRGLAPAGWHVPTLTEWNALEAALSNTPANDMRANSPSYWTDNSLSYNTSGFSAVGAGLRMNDAIDSKMLQEAHFWTSTIANTTSGDVTSFSKTLYSSSAYLYEKYSAAECALSIRCIKD